MTERELQSAVIECARLLGWRVAHFRPAETTKGWRTPVEADGKGFPDLVLVNVPQRRLLFAELKSTTGYLSLNQEEWLTQLCACGIDTYLWRPADWTSGRIEHILRGTGSGSTYTKEPA